MEDNADFAEKQKFPFPLLSDTTREVGLAYGACDDKQAGFARRITYVIDREGKVTHAFPKVDPRIHAAQILEALGATP